MRGQAKYLLPFPWLALVKVRLDRSRTLNLPKALYTRSLIRQFINFDFMRNSGVVEGSRLHLTINRDVYILHD